MSSKVIADGMSQLEKLPRVPFSIIVNYLDFEDKRNLRLVSLRLYKLMCGLVKEFNEWIISLTNINSSQRVDQLVTMLQSKQNIGLSVDLKDCHCVNLHLLEQLSCYITSLLGVSLKQIKCEDFSELDLYNLVTLELVDDVGDESLLRQFLVNIQATPVDLLISTSSDLLPTTTNSLPQQTLSPLELEVSKPPVSLSFLEELSLTLTSPGDCFDLSILSPLAVTLHTLKLNLSGQDLCRTQTPETDLVLKKLHLTGYITSVRALVDLVSLCSKSLEELHVELCSESHSKAKGAEALLGEIVLPKLSRMKIKCSDGLNEFFQSLSMPSLKQAEIANARSCVVQTMFDSSFSSLQSVKIFNMKDCLLPLTRKTNPFLRCLLIQFDSDCKSDAKTAKRLLNLVEKCPELETLKFEGVPCTDIPNWSQPLPKLTSLCLKPVKCKENSFTRFIEATAASLVRLTMAFIPSVRISACFAKLKILNLSLVGCNDGDMISLGALRSDFPRLERLILHQQCTTAARILGLEQLIDKCCSSLEYLSLNNIPIPRLHTCSFAKLRHLVIASSDQNPDPAWLLQLLNLAADTIQVLDLSYPNMDLTCLTKFDGKLPSLSRIYLKSWDTLHQPTEVPGLNIILETCFLTLSYLQLTNIRLHDVHRMNCKLPALQRIATSEVINKSQLVNIRARCPRDICIIVK